MRTYAVTWHEHGRPVFAGKLEVLPHHLSFEGAGPDGHAVAHELPYRCIASLRVGRVPEDLGEGRQALVIERVGDQSIAIASVSGLGLLAELAERLEPLVSTVPE
jgi:hypothetical protein